MDRALLFWVKGPIGPRVVNSVVLVLADQILGTKPGQVRRRWVDEDSPTFSVQSIDTFTCRAQNELIASAESLDRLLGLLATGYVLDLGYEIAGVFFRISHNRDVEQGPHCMTIGVKEALLRLETVGLAPQHPATTVKSHPYVVRMVISRKVEASNSSSE